MATPAPKPSEKRRNMMTISVDTLVTWTGDTGVATMDNGIGTITMIVMTTTTKTVTMTKKAKKKRKENTTKKPNSELLVRRRYVPTMRNLIFQDGDALTLTMRKPTLGAQFGITPCTDILPKNNLP